MKSVFAAYFDKNFIVKFIALHASMERHCQPYKLYVLTLCQESDWFLAKAQLPNVVGVSLKDVITPAMKAVQSERKHDPFIWALASYWIRYLLQHMEEDRVCFIDCDSWFWSNPAPLWDEIGDHEIAIVPHRFSPVVRHYVSNGIYNAGFVYVRQGDRAFGCIEQWCEDSLRWDRGPCSSQEELNRWPEEHGAYTIQHPGVNLAPWNQLGQYHYHEKDNVHYVDGFPLIWYHYHGGPNQGSYRLHYYVSNKLYPPYQRAIKSARVKAGEIMR